MYSILATALFACPAGTHADPYLVGSSPSISMQKSEGIFLPLVELLSRTTGEEFVYEHADNWPAYIENMRESRYQLLFDEPHLVGWRVENLDHLPLVKLSGTLEFVIVARTSDDAIVQLKDLAGYTVCARAAPALDGLVLFKQFGNPSRQPYLRAVQHPQESYGKLLKRNCRGAVLPTRMYERLAGNENRTQVLFLSESFPNWALSADPAIPGATRDRIKQVVLDPDNRDLSRKLNSVLATNHTLESADTTDYARYSQLLKNFWGLR